MKQKQGRRLDLVLVVSAAFFLMMGISSVSGDAFGAILGFGTAIPLAIVYFWRKRREARGLSVQIRGGTVALFIAALFFLVMALTELPQGGEGLAFGLVPGLLFAAAYWMRRRKELSPTAEDLPDPVDLRPAPAPAKPAAPAPSARPAVVPVTVCPHCGAPGKGDVCEYCGMSKKA